MNLLAAMRRRKEAWIRRLAAPVAAVWLTMAWQPCVMAMDAGMDHMAMDAGMDHEHPCEHCPPAETDRCHGAVLHDCGDEDRFSADLRAAKAKSAEDAKHVQTALAGWGRPHRLPVDRTKACRANPATAPPARPLPVLFCSYLN